MFSPGARVVYQIDLASSVTLLAEWTALITELDLVARDTLGVDAKGFQTTADDENDSGRRKRSNSFLARGTFQNLGEKQTVSSFACALLPSK